MSNMRKMYNKALLDNSLMFYKNCSNEEIKEYKNMDQKDLPDDIFADQSTFLRKYVKGDLSDDEMKIFLLTKINKNIRIIKSCAIFFVILAIIGIILGSIVLLSVSIQ